MKRHEASCSVMKRHDVRHDFAQQCSRPRPGINEGAVAAMSSEINRTNAYGSILAGKAYIYGKHLNFFLAGGQGKVIIRKALLTTRALAFHYGVSRNPPYLQKSAPLLQFVTGRKLA